MSQDHFLNLSVLNARVFLVLFFLLFTDNEKINFIGNVESKEVLDPPCDILISDGFTANMVMKTIAGTAKGMGKMLKNELKQGFFGKIGMLLSARNLKRFKNTASRCIFKSFDIYLLI